MQSKQSKQDKHEEFLPILLTLLNLLITICVKGGARTRDLSVMNATL